MSVRLTPSTVNVPPPEPWDRKFDCWPLSLPATLMRSIATPGALWRMTQGSRAVGIDFSSCWETTAVFWTRLVSSSGASLETVTAASTRVRPIGIVSSVLRPRLTVTFSRFTVWNPARVSVIVYVPGSRLAARNSPRASV